VTNARLRYGLTDEPVVAPTDLLHVKAQQATVLVECTACGWRSQPFQFQGRTAHLTLRSHFEGLKQGGKIKEWRCKRRQ